MKRQRKIFSLLWPLLLLAPHDGSSAAFAFPVSSLMSLFSVQKPSFVSKSRRTLSFNYKGFLQQQNTSPITSPFRDPTTIARFTWMQSKNTDVEDTDNGDSLLLPTWAVFATLSAQPVVWTSLYFVVTTGGGLPAGPFGLLGLLEGVSYLAVVGIVGLSLYQKVTTDTGLPAAAPNKGLVGAVEGLSYMTLLLGLLALASLVVDQGCVPNAKPLLDYSAYLPVCDPEQTPGLFGSN